MNLRFYLNNHCSVMKLAGKLGISPSIVSNWKNEYRPVPIPWCHAIESNTEGMVTRKELRPKDWQRIWPELAVADELDIYPLTPAQEQ